MSILHGMQRLLAGLGLGVICMAPAQAFEPGQVTCIAPSAEGGGWDFTCRKLAEVMPKLGFVSEPVEVVNMPGGVGATAFEHIQNERPNDPNVIIAASSVTVIQIALGSYGERSEKRVRWPGTLGADYGVIAVPPDSPLETLEDFVTALANDGIQVAGGANDDLKLRRIAREGGISDLSLLEYLPYNGGGAAFEAMARGEADALAGDISEVLPMIRDGRARALAVLSAERFPDALASVPTAIEQGYKVIVPNWRGIYLPGKISAAAYAFWTQAVATIYASPEWVEIMAESGLAPFPLSGRDMEVFVERQIHGIEQILQ